MTWLNLSVTLTEGGKRLEQLLQQLKLRQQEREQLDADLLPTIREILEPPEGSNLPSKRRRIEPIGSRMQQSKARGITYLYEGRFFEYITANFVTNLNLSCSQPPGDEIIFETNVKPWRPIDVWQIDALTGQGISGIPAVGYQLVISEDAEDRTWRCTSTAGRPGTQGIYPSRIYLVRVRPIRENGRPGTFMPLSPQLGSDATIVPRYVSWGFKTRLIKTVVEDGVVVETEIIDEPFPESPSVVTL
jgi:hypothetical protein